MAQRPLGRRSSGSRRIRIVVKEVVKKENWPELVALTSYLSVELPGIEPVSGCWSMSRTCTELRNDISCDSPELTSVDTECAQNVPIRSPIDSKTTYPTVYQRHRL